jgi:Protein of unknown function (DUF2380)
MHRSRLVSRVAITGFLLGLGVATGRGETAVTQNVLVGAAIADFVYVDTSGEPADQVSGHRDRLQAFMTALRADFEGDRAFRVLPSSCPPSCTDGKQGSGDRVAAKILVTGGIHKLSTLVQWAKVTAFEFDSNRVVFERLFTFRGDNDEAWRRAEVFVSQQVREALVAAPAPGPIKLAVFNFELEDASAGASVAGEAQSDVAKLADVTSEVRRLLASSGVYSLIDTGGADATAAPVHALHDCGGCDAPAALKLGAEQSLVGVVRRVSRTEYTVRFQIRDARSGAVVSTADSGLRMGADYAWGRGAVRLVKDRLLEGRPQQ